MRFCLLVLFSMAGPAVAATGRDGAGASRTTQARSAKVVPVLRADPRSGQFVRTVVVMPKLVESKVVIPFVPAGEAETWSGASGGAVRGLVEEAARIYDVSPALVDSVIQVESNYNARAVSPKGAQGLMQLMPATARRFGVTNSFDAKQNIEAGVRYLKFLKETFKDERLAIAAYNAGEGAVQKYGNIPPYPETMSYVARVGKKYGQARRAAEMKKSLASKPEAEPKAVQYRKLAQFTDAEGRVYLTTQ